MPFGQVAQVLKTRKAQSFDIQPQSIWIQQNGSGRQFTQQQKSPGPGIDEYRLQRTGPSKDINRAARTETAQQHQSDHERRMKIRPQGKHDWNNPPIRSALLATG